MAIEREYWKTAMEGFSLSNYPEINDDEVEFPSTIGIAYAVCRKECGLQEFIVDGSTQICRHCGKMMFRTAVREYSLIDDSTGEGKNHTP